MDWGESSIQCCGCKFEDSKYLTNFCENIGQVAMFMALLDYVIRTTCNISDPCRRAKPVPEPGYPKDIDKMKFHFVVVGGGVAGPIVASRLSDYGRWNVLLLEAGPEEPTGTTIPAFFSSAVGTDLDWQYVTVPQEKACLRNGGVCDWPRGKMMGGSASLSGSMYTRANKQIFDDWKAMGNYNWGFKEILPYFKKHEENLQEMYRIDKEFHGFEGNMPVNYLNYQQEMVTDLLAGANELGYQSRDLSGHNQTGFMRAPFMIKNGLRASTPRMYLRPRYKRENLFVHIKAFVTRIIIDSITMRATGVEYMDESGRTRTISNVIREVILSAGVVGSAQLLMLSGIGPKAHLEKVGIPVIKDLPVGQNLHHHVSVNFTLFTDFPTEERLSVTALKRFIESRGGVLSSAGITQIAAFMESKFAEKGVPDLQLFTYGYHPDCSNYYVKAGPLTDAYVDNSINQTRLIFTVVNLLPKSRGYIKLKSSDPVDYPIIDPRYLEVDEDAEVMYEGIKIALKLLETEGLKKWGVKLDSHPKAGCEHEQFNTEPYWKCVIQQHTLGENHHSGTVSMGPTTDPKAVVDPELRVHGMKNLRVIDASILPSPVNSNPISSVMMIAEKGADMIKEYHYKRASGASEISVELSSRREFLSAMMGNWGDKVYLSSPQELGQLLENVTLDSSPLPFLSF